MLFAVCALTVVGASWCLTGVIMGRAPKHGIDTGLLQMAGALVSVLVGTLIALALGQSGACRGEMLALGMTVYVFAGFFYFCGVQAMAEGMKRGPNGMVWGIMQSALVFPFIAGILFFGVELTIWRGAGIAFLLIALVLFGMAKDGAGDRRGAGTNWRFWAFLSCGLIAMHQILATAPSYFEELRAISPVLRSVASVFGAILAALLRMAWMRFRGTAAATDLTAVKKPLFWWYVFWLQFFGLLFAYTLFYPGMDAMARAGAGAVSYPLMVGSCIVSFSLYSIFGLREKAGPMQFAALACCLAGLAGLCVPA